MVWILLNRARCCLQVLIGLATASGNATNPAALRSTVQVNVVVGLLRDLRGITMATNSRKTYGTNS